MIYGVDILIPNLLLLQSIRDFHGNGNESLDAHFLATLSIIWQEQCGIPLHLQFSFKHFLLGRY